MIKIKLECWWCNTEFINLRLIRQFVNNIDIEKYQFVTEKPDFTIVFGKTDWEKIETVKEKTFYISQEPLWSPNQPRNDIHHYCSKILISDKRNYPDRDEYIETLIPMFYAGRGENDHREEWDWSLKIKDKSYTKTKLISMIVKKDANMHYGHLSNPETSEIIYNTRTFLGIDLAKNTEIDIYGNFWEKNNKNIKGEIWNKHIGLDDYRFSICCENTIQKNYISEKFWDAVITETIPIYLGCSNIDKLISPDSYINLYGLDMKQMTDKIYDVVSNWEDYYYTYYKNIINLKNDFFKNAKYNVWEKIKELIE